MGVLAYIKKIPMRDRVGKGLYHQKRMFDSWHISYKMACIRFSYYYYKTSVNKNISLYFWDANLKVRLFGEALFNMLYWMYFPFIAIYFEEALLNHAAGLLLVLPPLFSMLGNLVGGAVYRPASSAMVKITFL